jgi:hypothetical protein
MDNGGLYKIGREYMDVFVDLQDKTAVAAVMTAAGFDEETMRSTTPMFSKGNAEVYERQFAAVCQRVTSTAIHTTALQSTVFQQSHQLRGLLR